MDGSGKGVGTSRCGQQGRHERGELAVGSIEGHAQAFIVVARDAPPEAHGRQDGRDVPLDSQAARCTRCDITIGADVHAAAADVSAAPRGEHTALVMVDLHVQLCINPEVASSIVGCRHRSMW